MRGKKKLLEQIAKETNTTKLVSGALSFHRLSDLAAINDRDRDWVDYCELESACLNRADELKEKRESK